MSNPKRSKQPVVFTSCRGHTQEGPSPLENLLRGIPGTDGEVGPTDSMLEVFLSYVGARVIVSPQLMGAVGAGTVAPVAVAPLILFALCKDGLFLSDIAEQCLRILSRAPELKLAHRKHTPEPCADIKLEKDGMLASPGVAYKAFVAFKGRELVCELVCAPSPQLYLATLDDN